MKFRLKYIGIGLISSLVLIANGCKVDDPEIPNEEELITTIQLVLTPISGGESKTFTYKDLDGDGGNAAVITLDTLDLDSKYNGELKVLNELESPIEDITVEVKEEGEDHQFFFSNGNGIYSVMYKDSDVNGNPIGIKTQIDAIKAGKENLTIVLRHKPKKPNNGTLLDAGGETDIEISFEVVVQ